MTQKIVTNLWFDSQAEDAANFYTALFEDSKITNIAKFNGGGEDVNGMTPGQVMTVAFTLSGQEFLALNGGPLFKPNEAVSQIVNCKNQAEIDRLWTAFTERGAESQCGWLKDEWGFSWQIVPENMSGLMMQEDPAASKRVMEALMPMKKLDVATLQNAAKG